MGRGSLTTEIEEKAKELLNVDTFTQVELRLMPYIQYCMMNEQRIEHRRCNEREFGVLLYWEEQKWISLNKETNKLTVSKMFWDVINELMWMSYVSYH